MTPRGRAFLSTIALFPLLSGGFFGLVAGLLALRSGTIGRATAIGVLVGGVFFAANAITMCVVQSKARAARPRHLASAPTRPRAEARVS
jgi:hypothetical protein